MCAALKPGRMLYLLLGSPKFHVICVSSGSGIWFEVGEPGGAPCGVIESMEFPGAFTCSGCPTIRLTVPLTGGLYGVEIWAINDSSRRSSSSSGLIVPARGG